MSNHLSASTPTFRRIRNTLSQLFRVRPHFRVPTLNSRSRFLQQLTMSHLHSDGSGTLLPISSQSYYCAQFFLPFLPKFALPRSSFCVPFPRLLRRGHANRQRAPPPRFSNEVCLPFPPPLYG